MKDICRYIMFFVFIPFWWGQKLFFRKKNMWVFGAWFGERYTDNAKILFEYIHENSQLIVPIWITKDKKIHKDLNSQGITCYMRNSIKGVLACLRSGVFVFSSGKFDINPFLMNGAKSVQMWHGAPMKKIGLDDKFSKNNNNMFLRKNILPFDWEYNYDVCVSTSQVFNNSLCSAFDLNENQIITVGYPRNDVFFDDDIKSNYIIKLNKQFENPEIILYLPTFRDDEPNIDLFNQFKFTTKEWAKYLEETNTVFVYKNHFAGSFKEELTFSTERIIRYQECEEGNVNLFMKDVSLLITDYSGAYFDFKLTGKPVILAPFDIKTYVGLSRELYFDYDDIEENKANDWEEILDLLLSKEVCSELPRSLGYNDYYDGGSSKRLVEEIVSRFNIKI